MHWMRARRDKLNYTQQELAAKLQLAGFDVERTTISNWENDVSVPPIEDPAFGRVLANLLRMSIPDLLTASGYNISMDAHGEAARRAADILDQLPAERQRMVMNLLEQFLEEENNPSLKFAHK